MIIYLPQRLSKPLAAYPLAVTELAQASWQRLPGPCFIWGTLLGHPCTHCYFLTFSIEKHFYLHEDKAGWGQRPKVSTPRERGWKAAGTAPGASRHRVGEEDGHMVSTKGDRPRSWLTLPRQGLQHAVSPVLRASTQACSGPPAGVRGSSPTGGALCLQATERSLSCHICWVTQQCCKLHNMT